MRKKSTQLRLFAVILVLIAASVACGLPTNTTSNQRPPTPPPMDTQQVQQLEQNMAATLANPDDTGSSTVTITDQQINAYMKDQLASQNDNTITDPQVHLTNGTVEVYGKVNLGGITSDSKAVLFPEVDQNGKPRLKVRSITIGPVAVPQALVSQVDSQLQDVLANMIDANSPNMKVKNISITEGEMTITGSIQ